MEFSQIKNDAWEWMIFFLHFLVVTSTLFCLPWSYKHGHGFEDFVQSSHLLADEMFVIDLQEPMISLVLFQWPMTFPPILFIKNCFRFSFSIFGIFLAFRPAFSFWAWSIGGILNNQGLWMHHEVRRIFTKLKPFINETWVK